MNKKFSFKSFAFLFKILIVVVAVWYLYEQLFVKHNFTDIILAVQKAWNTETFGAIASSVVVLMLFNWGIEAYKWKFMIAKCEEISFLDSVESVFSGVTVSFFTPNRVGEFAGRIFFLEKADRVQAALISILGSMSQLIITLVAGGISLIFFLKMFVPMDPFVYYSISFLTIVFIFLELFIFFNVNVIHTLMMRLGLSEKFVRIADVFELFSPADLAKILCMSGLRYAIFTTQFLLLLQLMDVQSPVPATVMMISMTYLVMAIPTFALAELGVRSVVALQFIGILSGNESGIITASFMLYLVNVAFPAMLGALFVFKLKFFRSK